MSTLAVVHNIPAAMLALGALATIGRGFADPLGRELSRIRREHNAALRSIGRVLAQANAEMDHMVNSYRAGGWSEGGGNE